MKHFGFWWLGVFGCLCLFGQIHVHLPLLDATLISGIFAAPLYGITAATQHCWKVKNPGVILGFLPFWGGVWAFYKYETPHGTVDGTFWMATFIGGVLLYIPFLLIRRIDLAVLLKRTATNAAVASMLDMAILRWTPNDPFTMRNLLDGGICILGRPGSGKTSSSGMLLARGCVGYPGSGGLILSSSPTDLAMWQAVFKRAGRQDDLIVFGPKHPHQFNVIDYLAKLGADNRELAKAITTIGEAMDVDDSRSGGGESDKFWPMQVKTVLETAITVVMLAEGKVTIPLLHDFIISAAQTPLEMKDDVWKAKYMNRCFGKAHAREKTPIEQNNFKLAFDKWITQWPAMSDKTRSSVEAGVMGILHVFNSGEPRMLLSQETTVSPDVMDQGKWVFVDMSAGQYGSSGAFVLNSWRFATQKFVTRRIPNEWKNPIIIWADEAGKLVNSADSFYLTESRKFGGATVFLCQSMQSFHAALPGDRGKSQAEVLLGCFATKVAHAIGDPGTAEWLSKLLGKRLKTRININGRAGPQATQPGGESAGGFSSGTTLEPVLDTGDFMHNLRTGGKINKYLCDAVVLRSGEPFSSGDNHLIIPFSQRD
jgi:hypothetical protein